MKILVPTRGGETSYPNQDKSIALAKEKSAEILFLYITDVKFLDKVARPVTVDIAQEIDDMGEFLLVMAQERAAKQGVKSSTLVKRGEFRQVMESVIDEEQVDMLILGSPDEDTGHTTVDFIKSLSESIANDHNIDVIVLGGGEQLFVSMPK